MPREWKEEEIEELTDLIEENPVVGVISMHQLPAPQLQDMRKDLHGKAKIRMSRKTLMKFALENSSRENIEDLKEFMEGESAFIFTDMNPFKLYSYLQKNKSSAPARRGDIAPNDIVVNEGGTGIDPGPAIGKLQSVGLRTSMEEGKIHIDEESVVAEEGEEISTEVAEALKMLGMEPMEIGLNLKSLWEDGVIFKPEELEIDEEEYRNKAVDSYKRCLNLSVGIEYLTQENASIMVKKAWNEARTLALRSDFPTEETISNQIGDAFLEGKALKSTVEEVS